MDTDPCPNVVLSRLKEDEARLFSVFVPLDGPLENATRHMSVFDSDKKINGRRTSSLEDGDWPIILFGAFRKVIGARRPIRVRV